MSGKATRPIFNMNSLGFVFVSFKNNFAHYIFINSTKLMPNRCGILLLSIILHQLPCLYNTFCVQL